MKEDDKGADESQEHEPERDAEENEEREPADDEAGEAAADKDADTAPAAEAAAGPAAGPTAGDPEKPLFSQGWPADPELDRLLTAFERGNYAYVREHAPKVAERATDPAVKAAALDLRKRIDPAPLAGILIFVAVGLLVVLAGHYLGKHNPGAPPTVAPAPTNAPLEPPAPK